MLAASCNKEQATDEVVDNTLEKGKVYYEIKVTIDPETRGAFSDKSFAFQTGDEIAVIVTESGTPSVETLSVTANDGTTVTFGASLDSDAVVGDYAYYPASIANASTPTTITWPSSFDAAACGGAMVPMMAKIENNTAEFKHLGAMLKVALTNVPAGANLLEFTTSNNFTGTYDVNTSTWALTENTLSGNVETVSIDGNDTYYIPIPAGSYADFQLAMKEDAYYHKQRTADLASAITPTRRQIVNLGTFNYDVDQIAEWWHLSPINGWTSGYDRYIKTGATTYQLTVYNPSDNKYWKLTDINGDAWNVKDDATAWTGTLTKQGWTFNRTGADDKTFWVTLSTDGVNWTYNSGNWDTNSDRNWSAASSSVKISYNGNNYSMSKYNYNENYGYKYEGLSVPDNSTHTLKFILNWSSDSNNDTPSGVSGSLSITDACPYGSFEWGGANSIEVTLTQGEYDVYLDLAILNFMFVKQ